jgi:DNA-binding transcriptional regulator YhcF (GntR family)
VIEEGRALFLQIAESVEDSIVEGSLAEEAQAPSTNELAAFYRINPATAAKGIALLTDKGVIYKKRGIGMFVATGARDTLLAERRAAFAARFVDPLLAEGRTLGLGPDDLARMIRDRAAAVANTANAADTAAPESRAAIASVPSKGPSDDHRD